MNLKPILSMTSLSYCGCLLSHEKLFSEIPTLENEHIMLRELTLSDSLFLSELADKWFRKKSVMHNSPRICVKHGGCVYFVQQ